MFWCSAFFIVQLSHPCMTTGKTKALTRWTFVGKVMSLLQQVNLRIQQLSQRGSKQPRRNPSWWRWRRSQSPVTLSACVSRAGKQAPGESALTLTWTIHTAAASSSRARTGHMAPPNRVGTTSVPWNTIWRTSDVTGHTSFSSSRRVWREYS